MKEAKKDKNTRQERAYLEHDIVVHQLHKTDQGERHGSRNQVSNIRLGIRVPQPAHDIESLGMENRGILGPSMIAQDGSHVLDIILDQGGIGSVDVCELVKVLLDVALSAKDGKDLCRAVECGGKEGRGWGSVVIVGEDVHGTEEGQGGEEGVHDDDAGILGEGAGDDVDIISSEIFGDEEQENCL